MKNSFKSNSLSLILFLFLLPGFQIAKAKSSLLKLWYDKPTKDWMTEALPIGNGRLAE